jgi:hypothetical protein
MYVHFIAGQLHLIKTDIKCIKQRTKNQANKLKQRVSALRQSENMNIH